MWKPRWLRNKNLPNIPTEFTTHVARYELDHDDGHKVILTVHLPSRRVSESHYDSRGILKKYICKSPTAEQHIEYLCANDSSGQLRRAIQTAESIQQTNELVIKNIQDRARTSATLIKIMLIGVAMWLTGWGFIELILRGII